MLTVAWVAVGGAAGSVARHLVATGLNGRYHPWGTVLVNVVGSLALGFLVGQWGMTVDSPARLGVTVGLLGGFTTFSTFSLDTIRLWENAEIGLAVTTVALSLGLGLGAAVLGMVAGRA